MHAVIDYAGLSEERRADIERRVARLASLHDVLAWGLAQSPPCDISSVVTQDEFTNDVVLPWRDGLTLVFDTT
jgi:hypothetical protein